MLRHWVTCNPSGLPITQLIKSIFWFTNYIQPARDHVSHVTRHVAEVHGPFWSRFCISLGCQKPSQSSTSTGNVIVIFLPTKNIAFLWSPYPTSRLVCNQFVFLFCQKKNTRQAEEKISPSRGVHKCNTPARRWLVVRFPTIMWSAMHTPGMLGSIVYCCGLCY